MVDWKTRRIRITPSPWASHATDAVFVREVGSGTPILFLHGGWGYGIYPIDDVVGDLAPLGYRFIVPDRVGYGRSSPLDVQPLDFHQRAATESLRLLDELGGPDPMLWGHSDGAVIALRMALSAPLRFPGLVLEAMHFWQNKPASTPFFESAAKGDAKLGSRSETALETDHGLRWKQVVEMNAKAWVDLAHGATPGVDLYRGTLKGLRVPTLLLHGQNDPRTEVGEIEAAQEAIAGAQLVRVEGKHAPHAEPRAWQEARGRIVDFLERVRPRR